MFAASREAAPPSYENEIQAKTTMITAFFIPTRLSIPDPLRHGQRFTQDYFRTEVLFMLHEENVRFRRKHSDSHFRRHINNSRCHNGKKITVEIKDQKIARAPHHVTLRIPVLAISGSLV
jgi:hypothetical protein